MAQSNATPLHADAAPAGGPSLRGSFYAIGFLGLAIAVASIADMFSPRPSDGIVPVPYSHGGIEVREVLPGGPSERAGIRADRQIEERSVLYLIGLTGPQSRVLQHGYPVRHITSFYGRPTQPLKRLALWADRPC